MFDFLFGGNPANSWTNPVGCRGTAEYLLTREPAALKLVFCLKKFSDKLNSRQGAALDVFTKDLKTLASDKDINGSELAEAMAAHLEKLNRAINATDAAYPSEQDSSPPLGSGTQSPVPPTPSSPSSGDTEPSPSPDSYNQPPDRVPDIRGTSPREEKTFVDLFGVIQATPRRIKRVVNLCVC